ncbi:MAG: DNA-directed RNA polymerase subunit P [Nanoarchaeota archaeon]|nr:DNA-directed RNA polymerase subunit P [Nanoarchaeota archaeon]
MYKCQSCTKDVKIEFSTNQKIQCPFCGFRIIRKTRPPIIKKVLAR